MSINQELRAAKAWIVLGRIAADKKTIRYSELSRLIGMSHHRPLRYVLGYLQDYCLDAKLPPLTILVVNQSNNPGGGFIAWDTDNLKQGYLQVYSKEWESEPNPFQYALEGYDKDAIIEQLLNHPLDTEEIYSVVKVRGMVQQLFRRALIEAYACQCAICGFSFSEALEAAHIIPWSKSTPLQRLDIRNGMLLCGNHHRLFDNNWISINDDYSIFYSDMEMEYGPYSASDKAQTLQYHGKKLLLPEIAKYRPLPEYLLKRIEMFK